MSVCGYETGTREYLTVKHWIDAMLPSTLGALVDVAGIAERSGIPVETIEGFLQAVYPSVQVTRGADGDHEYHIAEGPIGESGDTVFEEPGREWLRRASQNAPRDRHQPTDDQVYRWS